MYQRAVAHVNDAYCNSYVLTFAAPVLAASACLAAAGSALGSHERVCKAIGVDCAHVARESCAVRCALCPLSRSIARLACTEYLLRCQRELRLLAVVDRDASDALD